MRHRLLLPILLASTIVALGACDDDLTDPDGLGASAEAEAIMRSAAALPLLPRYLDAASDATDRATVQRARQLWDAGTAIDDAHADSRRRLAVRHALPALLETVSEAEWAETRQRLDEWMATAGSMLPHLELPVVETRIQTARGHLSRSDAATSDRDRAYHLLLAGSELVPTTPRFVARAMARDAERAVQRAAAADDPPSASIMKRAERLKDWSARAVEDGEYVLAIQRGYYAIQLVEER